MSTRINVTVGDGGLLDRNAQQTAANRQARVLADQRATAEAEGVERRAADRTAAGLDPLTGLPASTPSSASTINRLDQEPAANRRGQPFLVAHSWRGNSPVPTNVTVENAFSLTTFGPLTPWQVVRFLRESILPKSSQLRTDRGSASGTQWQTKQSTQTGSPALSQPYPSLLEVRSVQDPFDPNRQLELFFFAPITVLLPGGDGVVNGEKMFYLPLDGSRCIAVQMVVKSSANFYYTYGLNSLAAIPDFDVEFFAPFIRRSTDKTTGVADIFPTDAFPEGTDFGTFFTSPGVIPLEDLRNVQVPYYSFRTDERPIFPTYLTTGSVENHVFLCDKNSIQEINAPVGLQAIIDALNPPFVTEPFNLKVSDRQGDGPIFPVTRTRQPNVPFFADARGYFFRDNFGSEAGLEYDDNIDNISYTPQVYERLNNVVPFTPPTDIRTFSAQDRAVLTDRTRGGFSVIRTVQSQDFPEGYTRQNLPAKLYETGIPLYYAGWKDLGETAPDPRVWDPAFEDLGLPKPLRSSAPSVRFAENRQSVTDITTLDLVQVYDWGDPAYCKRMLRALGFGDDILGPAPSATP
jgi:hypothetical protein